MEYISWAQIVFLGAGIAQACSIGGYAAQLRRMNYQLNWEVTANWAPAHGLWMPYNLSSGRPYGGNWTSCLERPDFASDPPRDSDSWELFLRAKKYSRS